MDPFVSSGTLPPADVVAALVTDAHERFRDDEHGANSDVYPALTEVPSNLFGLCVVGTNGNSHAAGDADVEFSIMSVAKPFVFALVCDVLGPDGVRERVGVNATGLPFNSVEAIDRQGGDGRTNPMVNPGAIATTSLVPGATADERWQVVVGGLSRFAGRQLALDAEIYDSASATNHRNREIIGVLDRYGRIVGDPSHALDLYTRQSSLRVTARDLAVMGATLADGGVNPLTGELVVDAACARCALVVMSTAGLYETSLTSTLMTPLNSANGLSSLDGPRAQPRHATTRSLAEDGGMEAMSSDVLESPAYSVPLAPPAPSGVGWLRSAVVRFSEGDAHRRRRALVVNVIDRLGRVPDEATPTRSLLAALGLPLGLDADVAAVAMSYQPHLPQTADADRAADRLVAACGGRTEEAAAIACVLVQAHAAMLALLDERRAGSSAAPVPFTRRVAPSGEEVLVDLGDAHFGRGPHRCPGEALALHLADQALD